MMSSMVSGQQQGDDHSNPVSRTTSNFDTHIMVQKREKYFDKLGVNAENGEKGSDEAAARAESRRVSRGLSTFDFQFQSTQNSNTTRESQRLPRTKLPHEQLMSSSNFMQPNREPDGRMSQRLPPTNSGSLQSSIKSSGIIMSRL